MGVWGYSAERRIPWGWEGQAGGRGHFHEAWRLNLCFAPVFVLQLDWG